jgi:hypothetical protein
LWQSGWDGLPSPVVSPFAVYSFNDLHGRICPVEEGTRELHPGQGLVPRLAEERKNAPASLLLGCGDDRCGTVFDFAMEDPTLPDPAYSLYQACGVDALVPGNHDCDWGSVRYGQKLVQREQSMLSIVTNAARHSALDQVTASAGWIVQQPNKGTSASPVGAILGVTTTYQNRAAGEILSFEILGQWVDAIPDGIPLIVLSHLGGTVDRDLAGWLAARRAGRAEGCLILGGHSHETLCEPEYAETPIPYLQAGKWGAFFGLAQWSANGWKILVKAEASLPTLKNLSPKVADWKEVWEGWLRSFPVRGSMSTVPVVKKEQAYQGFCPQMAYLADALRNLALAQLGGKSTLPVLAGLCVRTVGQFMTGPAVNRFSLYDWLPYPDVVAVVRLPTDCLPELLRRNAERLLHPPCYMEEMGFLHFDYTLKQQITLSAAAVEEVVGEWENRSGSSEFYWVTTDYAACGSGGFGRLFKEVGISNYAAERFYFNRQPFREWLFESAQRETWQVLATDPGRLRVDRLSPVPTAPRARGG